MRTLLFGLLSLVSFSAHAINCEQFVSKLDSMQGTTMSQLKLSNPDDVEKGRAQQDNVLAQIDTFNKIPVGNCLPNAFKALAGLFTAQVPFDGESEVQQALVKILAQHPELTKVYEDVLHGFPDQCRSQRISLIVTELQNTAAHKKTPPFTFNFEQCEGLQAAKAEKKSLSKIGAAQPCPSQIHQAPGNVTARFFSGGFLQAMSESSLDPAAAEASSIARNAGRLPAGLNTSFDTRPTAAAAAAPTASGNSRSPASVDDPSFDSQGDSAGSQQ